MYVYDEAEHAEYCDCDDCLAYGEQVYEEQLWQEKFDEYGS